MDHAADYPSRTSLNGEEEDPGYIQYSSTQSILQEDLPSCLPDEHPALDESSPLLGRSGKHGRQTRPQMGKRRIWKNLLTLSVAYTFIYTSFGSLQNLESSLDLSSGLGVTTLACAYAGQCLSSLYAPLLIRAIGTKCVMLLQFLTQVLFAAAHYVPVYYTLIPAACLLGLVSSPGLSAMLVYMTNIAREYTSVTGGVDSEPVISWFNGIFLGFFQLNQIVGNLVSSSILQVSTRNSTAHDINRSVNRDTCGAEFCTGDNVTDSANFQHPPDQVVNVLVTVFIGCCIAGILLMLFVMDRCRDLDRISAGSRPWTEEIMGTVLVHVQPWMACLIPLFFWTGVEQALLFSEYTGAFITCQVGIGQVGYAMMGFGAVNVIGSVVIGRIERYSGRPSLVMCGGVLNLSMLLVMLFWKPGEGPEALLYVIPVFWGLGDAIWQTVTPALIGTEFPGVQESAFSMYRMWQAAGFAVMFAISQFLCMDLKIYITLSLLVLTVSLYLVAEVGIRHNKSRPWLDPHAPSHEE